MGSFANKVVWITGASSGYGLALAKQFAKEGARLILSARSEEKLHVIASQLPNAKILPLDISQSQQLQAKVQEAITLYGHIDIVVHNAGIAQRSAVLETSPPAARKIMEVDYFGHTELTLWLLPHFIDRKSGHIVVISGLLARLNLPGRSSYAAAKAALIAYFGCLRAEVKPYNIDITVLIPGSMQTELASKALGGDGLPLNIKVPTTGCTTEKAAIDSLAAITNKEYESYIGLQDEAFQLWQLTLNNANQGIQLLLDKLNAKNSG